VVITGSTSGLGRQAAEGFVELGSQVVIHGPSADRTAKVAQEVQEYALSGGKAIPIHADLNDFDQIRAMAKEIIKQLTQVDILYLNAAYMYGLAPVYAGALKRVMSLPASQFVAKNGQDFVMTVNHYGHHLLMMELASSLAPGARVVILTGEGAWHATGKRILKPGRHPWDHPGWRPHAHLAYSDSKYANVCYARALRRHIQGKATVILLDPGVVSTATSYDRRDPYYQQAKYLLTVDNKWHWWHASTHQARDFMLKIAFVKNASNTDMVSMYFFPKEITSLIAGQDYESTKMRHIIAPKFLANQWWTFGKMHASIGPGCDIVYQEKLWVKSEEIVNAS